jgi:DNA-binding response OmpR family regulator
VGTKGPLGVEHVLVIEDDEHIRDIVIEVLNEVPERVVTWAADPSEVEAGARPDIVITDLVGPLAHHQGEGSRYIARLREQFPDARILVLTAQAWPVTARGDLPIDGFIAKPFDVADLVHRIDALGGRTQEAATPA